MNTPKARNAESVANLANDWQNTGVTSSVGLLLLFAFYAIIYPTILDSLTPVALWLQKILSELITMTSNFQRTLIKTPSISMVNLRSGPSSPLHKIFGLDAGSLLRSPQGDFRRGFGSLLSGKDSDLPAGLGNWDNSCYQNSVIQGLSSVSSLPRYLRAVVSRQGATGPDTTNGTLLAMIEGLNDDSNHGRYLWLPSKLKSMSTWQQQDAQEYYSKILDQLDKEAVIVTKSDTGDPGLASLPVDDDPVKNVARGSQDPLRSVYANPLEGMIAQRVSCTSCGYSDCLSMIPFNCLTVPLGEEWRADIQVEDCLDKYTELEFIQGVECPKCTLINNQMRLEKLLDSPISEQIQAVVAERLRAINAALEEDDFADSTLIKKCHISKKNWTTSTKTKQAVLARLPDALVIHLNRSIFNEFTGSQMKNGSPIRFHKELNLRRWCLGSALDEEQAPIEGWSMKPLESMLPSPEEANRLPPCMYSLRAVVTHRGSHENGHYVCFRKHLTKRTPINDKTQPESTSDAGERWWRLSDEDVINVDEETVLAQSGAFMLFYERIPPAPLKGAIPAAAMLEVDSTMIPRPQGTDELAADDGQSIDTEGFWTEHGKAIPHVEPPTKPPSINVESQPTLDNSARRLVSLTDSEVEPTAVAQRHQSQQNRGSDDLSSPTRTPIMMRTSRFHSGQTECESSFSTSARMIAAT